MSPARRKKPNSKGPKRVKRTALPPERLEPYREPPDRARVNYTFALSERICERLANGETGTAICREPDMPTWSALQRWIREKPDFARRYRIARESGYEYWADDTVDIADTTQSGEVSTTQEWGTQVRTQDMLEHRRLRIDARKWLLCKRARHIYGERTEHALSTPDGPLGLNVEDRSTLIDAIVKLVHPKDDGQTKPSGKTEESRER